MRKNATLAGLAVAAGLMCLTACESTRQKEKPAAYSQNNPGALPTSPQPDITPQLNASTYMAHGDLLERQGHFAQAAVQYRKALELAPDMATARNRLGITLNKLGQHPEATREFRAALQRMPDSAQVHNNLGFSLHLEGKYQEAEQSIRRALQLQPEFRRAHMNLGTTLAKMNRFEEALAEYLLAVPEADAHYNLAVMQVEARRYADAARSLETALKFNPELTAAREQLREVARLAAAVPPQRPSGNERTPLADGPPRPTEPGKLASAGGGSAGQASNGNERLTPALRPAKSPAMVRNSPVNARVSGAELASDVQVAPAQSRPRIPGEQELARAELYRMLVQRELLPENYADNPAIADPGLKSLLDSLLQTSPWTDGTLSHLRELIEKFGQGPDSISAASKAR